MKNIINTGFAVDLLVKPSCNATFRKSVRGFFESIKKKCRELSLVSSECNVDVINMKQ